MTQRFVLNYWQVLGEARKRAILNRMAANRLVMSGVDRNVRGLTKASDYRTGMGHAAQ
jgi:hypothetical protein